MKMSRQNASISPPKYLEELPFDSAMGLVYSQLGLEPHKHKVATGDFMGMCTHDIACPVCFDAPAKMHRDVTPGRCKQTVQPCDSCTKGGYIIAKLPRILTCWFWWRE